MTNHLTVRMAWHDNNWDGKICKNPDENFYCVGSHSLLSARIARNRDLEIERKNAGKKIDKIDSYIPPCFWSCNAFSNRRSKIKHELPFSPSDGKVDKIDEVLAAYSVFSWPFRLSFNHSKEKKKREGSYPPDLERRITKFIDKFKGRESIVFFYLNYDNPISADEIIPRYVLLGCALLSGIGGKKYYNFRPSEALQKMKSREKMKNFTPINWALQFNFDFKNNGILLPYNKYLEYIERNPEDENKLKEMRVLIEEENLIPSFKYVAMDIDDDKCLYLLYKLKKSIDIIQEHGIVDLTREKEVIERLIGQIWKRRGLYPSLKHILDMILDEYEEESTGAKIVSKIQENIHPKKDDLLESVFDLLDEGSEIPGYLSEFSADIEELKINIDDYSDDIELLKKLSLFSLTKKQLERIIHRTGDPFKKQIKSQTIVSNPYILAEEYIPEEVDLDEIEISDDPIDVFKIDIGMFPDKKYLRRNIKLQNLTQRSPERLRAIIINYLYYMGRNGDCYGTVDDLFEYIISCPLFYKEELNIDKGKLYSKEGKYHEHFKERLAIIENEGEFFFYLNEVKYAEELIHDIITELIKRPDYKVKIDDLPEFIEIEKEKLKEKIPDFEERQFTDERTKLLKTLLTKSFYIITGKPGSGKTKVLEKIVGEIRKRGEQVTLLAPTGKAALRLTENVKKTKEKAQTMDMFIFRNGYSDYLEDFENIILKKGKEKIRIDNLIIDESSMVDLQKLATLFSMIEFLGKKSIKRIILVGDEYQLPPIGFGKPFYDIVEFVKGHEEHSQQNFIKLTANCRQEFDRNILQIADIFTEKNRYYEKWLDAISKGGWISKCFFVALWENKGELYRKIEERLVQIMKMENVPEDKKKAQRLNLLLGLTPAGSVKHRRSGDFQDLGIKLDNFQILSPYRSSFFGTLGMNEKIQLEYREKDDYAKQRIFYHSDKIICINNWYTKTRPKELILSNGSIGIITTRDRYKREYYFLDQGRPLYWIDEDNFELAYAITIHKSQGSDFKHIFLVIPNKSTLLSKELLYTALTRSTYGITLFLQENKKRNNLEVAKNKSFVLLRNTSTFKNPENKKGKFYPDPDNKNIFVKSKIEYIIYRALTSERAKGTLDFKYEEELVLKNKSYPIHPDFTIEINGKTYYWEHLGELDIKFYSEDWEDRQKDYEINGLLDFLITTDDLEGVEEGIIHNIVEDLKRGKLIDTKDSKFSNHHYKLYSST